MKKTQAAVVAAFIGVFVVYVVISIAAAGYKFGQYLAS
jgi:hypothetical protein